MVYVAFAVLMVFSVLEARDKNSLFQLFLLGFVTIAVVAACVFVISSADNGIGKKSF